ncbi:hypothetical protein IGL98_003215 [Enterococcus sp. DIV0840]|uniref:helix-turn-helix domain-containing protein n=1 Tax=Enterococcus TaxID=1350 RepID=UPI001A8F4234|nr:MULTISPECIES: helix-turn-helix domain-containing protein [Enterococcus]MBO0436144.1 helix-turn-helix domain-containing protein [Enterococcus sp. DIV0849a]MBO0475285.1 helix-turn-helix domain-containing protein [Enterococcus ureasiticus]
MILLKSKNPFITKKEVTKLHLLNYLLENGSVNLDDLIDLYNTSQRTARNLVIELLEDITSVDRSLDISLIGNTLKFGNNFKSKVYLKVYKTLQLTYYENSISFQLFILLYKSKSISVYDLVEKLGVSQSYLYKLIKNLSMLLKSWAVDVQIDIQAYKVSLIGDESEIRCIAYYIFSLVFNTMSSKLKLTAAHPSISFVNSSKYAPTTNQLITIVEKIFILRQQQLMYVAELRQEESDFVSLIKRICPTYALSSFDNNESSCMLLWLVYVAPDIITTDEKKKIGEELWQNDSGTATLFKSFIQSLKKEFGCSKDTMYLLMWEYYARFIVYRYFKCWKYKNIIEIKRSKNKFIDQISAISMVQLKGILPPLSTDQYIDELSELTYSYLNLLIPLKIHVDLLEYSSIRVFIENILKHSYSNEVLLFTDNPQESDLIITNVISADVTDKELFFFTDINSKTNWEELGKAIQRHLLKINWPIPHS